MQLLMMLLMLVLIMRVHLLNVWRRNHLLYLFITVVFILVEFGLLKESLLLCNHLFLCHPIVELLFSASLALFAYLRGLLNLLIDDVLCLLFT